VGPKVDDKGNINGAWYNVGPAVGDEVKFEAGSSVNIVNWNISKGWKGFSSPLKAPDIGIGLPSPSSCAFIPWC
jgi:hypothetical protein